jgi:hypothetical protein
VPQVALPERVRPSILALSLPKFNHGNCLGNLIPKTIVKLYKIAVSALETGNVVELQAARDLQDLGLWRNLLITQLQPDSQFGQWQK